HDLEHRLFLVRVQLEALVDRPLEEVLEHAIVAPAPGCALAWQGDAVDQHAGSGHAWGSSGMILERANGQPTPLGGGQGVGGPMTALPAWGAGPATVPPSKPEPS